MTKWADTYGSMRCTFSSEHEKRRKSLKVGALGGGASWAMAKGARSTTAASEPCSRGDRIEFTNIMIPAPFESECLCVERMTNDGGSKTHVLWLWGICQGEECDVRI